MFRYSEKQKDVKDISALAIFVQRHPQHHDKINFKLIENSNVVLLRVLRHKRRYFMCFLWSKVAENIDLSNFDSMLLCMLIIPLARSLRDAQTKWKNLLCLFNGHRRPKVNLSENWPAIRHQTCCLVW